MILADELKLYLSGGSSNSDLNLSIGGARSSVEVLENLFNSVLNSHIVNDYEDYRCIYFYNSSSTESIINLRILTALDETGDDSDLFLSVAKEGKNIQVDSLPTSSTSPNGQVFMPCVNDSTALSLGDLEPNEFIGVWLKRTVKANPALKGSCTVNFFIKADTP